MLFKSSILTEKSKMSTKVEVVSKVETGSSRKMEKKEDKNQRKSIIGKKPKFENENRHHKHGRKRTQSFCAGGNNKFLPPHKKRKKEMCLHTQNFAPPTKFLLGGNICDPLNLNSLQDEEINKAMNAVTPKSSPLPTPKRRRPDTEAVIPPIPEDTLNLLSGEDEADYEAQLISPIKRISRKKKKRPHKKSLSSSANINALTTNIANSENVVITPTPTSGIFFAPRPVIAKAEVVPKGSPDIDKQIIEEARLETKERSPEMICNSEAKSVVDCVKEEKKEENAPAEETKEVTPTVKEEFVVPHPIPHSHPLHHSREHLHLSVEQSDNPQDKDSKSNFRKSDIKDKIVSPVVPQPRINASRFRQMPGIRVEKAAKGQKTPKFNEKNARFQYGNYNRYYGYRNPNFEADPRVKCLAKKKDLFSNKDVLDIGCNIGHITLTIARDFNARSVVGLDIDKKLIQIARTNVKHYLNCVNSPANPHLTPDPTEMIPSSSTSTSTSTTTSTTTTTSTATATTTPSTGMKEETVSSLSPAASMTETEEIEPSSSTSTSASEAKQESIPSTSVTETKQETTNFFPISMPIIYGPVQVPGTSSSHRKGFPHNVSFVQGNYVLESDVLISMEQPQFDVILCLSLTKWIQLNWGDAGLKRAFKRMFAQLRPGGILVLEPQSWPSYKKKRNLTETIWRNYKSVKFFPHQYSTYLLSVVGFSKCEVIATPLHQSKGFQRPIKVYTKGANAPLCRSLSLKSEEGDASSSDKKNENDQ